MNEVRDERPMEVRKAGSVSPPKLLNFADFETYEFFENRPSLAIENFKEKFKKQLDDPGSFTVNQDRIKRLTKQLIYG